jgi:hypothetical protein
LNSIASSTLPTPWSNAATRVPAVNLWVKGEPAARLPFERIGSDLTPYPFLHIFPQDQQSVQAFAAAPIGNSSMSPTLKPPALRLTASYTSTLTRPISWRSFPSAGKGRARLIGTVRDERADHAKTLKFEDVSDRAITNLKVKSPGNWSASSP